MHSVFGKPMTPQEYSVEWLADSDAFKRANSYGWMSEQLGKPELILEVGCGTGRSTLELAKRSRVICLEPNTHMAEIARDYLISSGVSAHIAGDPSEGSDHQVVILIADILDRRIFEILRGVRAAAITCWLIGAEPERIAHHLSRDLNSFAGSEMSEYREMVHRQCYAIGTEILTPGGVVQIVDRLFIPSWSGRDHARSGFSEMHQELAGSFYNVPLESTRFTRYKRPFTASHIRLMVEEDPRGYITVFGSAKAMLQAGKV